MYWYSYEGGRGGQGGDWFGRLEVLPGGFLGLGLRRKDDGVGGDFPIGSVVEGKGGGQGGVKWEEDDE